MQDHRPGLTAEDHGFRHAARAYFDEKAPAAAQSFDPEQLRVFDEFRGHWADFFAPEDPERLREYLASPFEVRKARFERFMRECRAWEISFRLSVKPNGRSPRPQTSDLHRRLEEQRERTERVRDFYQSMDDLFDPTRKRRVHPLELMPHLRILELPRDATLDDVKRQYKRLARVHHPDLQGDPQQMSKLNHAYRAILASYQVA